MEEKKNNRGGARPGAGRKKLQNKKVDTFFGYKVTKEDKERYKNIFEKFKSKYNLSSTKAILKIFDIIEEKENLK